MPGRERSQQGRAAGESGLALIAAWAVVTGVVEVEAGVRLRRLASGETSLLLAGGLSLVVGIALVALPESEAVRLAWAIGGFGVLSGATLMLVATRLRRPPQLAGTSFSKKWVAPRFDSRPAER